MDFLSLLLHNRRKKSKNTIEKILVTSAFCFFFFGAKIYLRKETKYEAKGTIYVLAEDTEATKLQMTHQWLQNLMLL